MRRTWLFTPLVFLLLILFGVNSAIARFVDGTTSSAPSSANANTVPDGVLVASRASATSSIATPSPIAPTPAFLTSSAPSVVASLPPVTLTLPPMATAFSIASATSVHTQIPIQTQTATLSPPTSTPTRTIGTKAIMSPVPNRVDLAPKKIGNERLPTVGAREFVIIDGDSGSILAEQNAHRQVAPASTTKIVTALLALSLAAPSDSLTAKFDAAELIDSTLMGLRQNDRVTLADLLFGLMLPSGNDSALAIANHVAGSKLAFVGLMNQLVTDLRLRDSHFTNPHGLDENGHYSSAYDMVQFARAGMNDARFHQLSSSRSRVVQMGNRTVEIFNLNRVLSNVNGADGIKIGYTEDAGRTIVASVTRNGRKVYIGAFHSSDLVADCRPLFDWAYRNFSWTDVPIQGSAN